MSEVSKNDKGGHKESSSKIPELLPLHNKTIWIQNAKEEKTQKDSSSSSSSSSDSGGGQEEDSFKGQPKPLTKWQKIGYSLFGLSFVGSIITYAIIFSYPEKDENGEYVRDEFSDLPFFSQHFSRLKNNLVKTKKDFEEPFSDKILPDPLKEPYYQPKYTVFVELTGLLVHATWTHKHGWRFQKRPGVDMFLSQIGYPNFELVIYTTEIVQTFYPIIEGLDPNNQYIMHRLFRDGTRYINGHHTKDISATNRDPKKCIVIDWNKNSVQLQPENGLILKKWEGDTNDRHLIGLAQLLQAIRQTDVDDVRDVLQYYSQYDDPIEIFRENQRKLQEQMIASEERKQQEMDSKKFLSSSGITSSLFSRRR